MKKEKTRKPPRKSRLRCFREQMESEMRGRDRSTFRLYRVLRALVIVAGISALIEHRYEYVAMCALVLLLFLLPSFIERKLRIDLPSTLEKIILLFAYSAEILGEMQSFYIRFAWWDTMLHTLNGFLCAAIGFALVDILNTNPKAKFNLSPFYLAVVAFCFSMTVGVVWEFFEFGMDCFFHLDMQKDTVLSAISSVKLDPTHGNTPYRITDITSVAVNGRDLGLGGYLDIGLFDTMKDLLANFVGAAVFSVIGYFYVASRGKNKFASQFIPVRVDGVTMADAADGKKSAGDETAAGAAGESTAGAGTPPAAASERAAEEKTPHGAAAQPKQEEDSNGSK